MKPATKRLLCAAAVSVALLCSGCQDEPPVSTKPSTEATEPAVVEQLTMVVTEDTISQLNNYPDLKELDLSGSTCYAAIQKYIAAHPGVSVTYTVDLGGTTADSGATALTLEPGTYNADTLLENLRYLPNVTQVDIPNSTMTALELKNLRQNYPDITWNHTVNLAGTEVSGEAEQVDLSALESSQVADAAQALALLPNLKKVELMDASGQSMLTMEDVKVLVDAAPDASFHYTFQLFGKTVSTDDETIEFVNEDIGNEGEAELRRALDILTDCTYFKLDDCGLDNEVLAQMRDDYPETKIVWRIHVWKRSWLTDTEILRAVYHVEDDNCEPLKYCTDVKYMDIGHNATLTDCSFVAYMPNLEICIVSGSGVTDISGFANCKKLYFLELAYCGSLKDISALSECTSLAYLNISYTLVRDISCLDELPLERLCCVQGRLSGTEQARAQEKHPDCWFRFNGTQPYGMGWRYDDNGYTYSEIYKKVREVFNYDEIDKILAAENDNE